MNFASRQIVCAVHLALMWLAGCAPAPFALEHWQLALDPGGPTTAVDLPGHLDTLIPDRDRTYELSTDYTLPAALRGRDLDFVIPHFWGHTELWVNGARAVSAQPAPRYGHRPIAPHVYRLPAGEGGDGILHLRLRVRHRWSQSAWFDVVPRLVRDGETDNATAFARLFDDNISIVAAALLFQTGIAALAIFFIGGRRREYWWLALQALLAASYPIFIHGDTQRIFGIYEVPVVAAALIVAVWASLRFAHVFFERERWSRRWDVLCAGGVFVCLLGLDPYWCTALAARATVLVLTACVISQVRLGGLRLLDPRTRHDARWFTGCWLALGLTTWSDMFTWLGLGEVFGGAHVACVGLAAFSFFLSLSLSQRHLSSLSRSDGLAVELEERVQELERDRLEIAQLNGELRRQIAERSEQIYAALALREDGARGATTLQEGDVVQGRYRVIGLRGAGGMGTVYEVERLHDGTRLALKLARESHGQALALLAREAQIAAQLAHENIAKIVDVDVASSGFLFFVMELVPGRPLQYLAARFGELGWALTVLRQIASGLATLHRAGIVHRDVKPPNILVQDADTLAQVRVKITDFGIARFSPVDPAPKPLCAGTGMIEETAPTSERDTVSLGHRPGSQRAPASSSTTGDTGLFTRSGQVAGTPIYMAPELVQHGTKASAKADVYSLGVLAWELLARRRPSLRPAVSVVLAGEIPYPPPSLALEALGLSPTVTGAIDACLALDPSLRPDAHTLEQIFAAACRDYA